MMRIGLPNSIVTPLDAQRLIREVRAYSMWFNKELIKRKVNGTPDQTVPAPFMSAETKQLLRQWQGQYTLDQKQLETLIATLEAQQAQSPVITITLAGPAPTELKQQLVGWCRKEIRSDLFVSFQFDPTLLGGMIIRAGSHIYDWSFREKLLTPKRAFSEVLRSV